jgi:excisionase family DNA binding protein
MANKSTKAKRPPKHQPPKTSAVGRVLYTMDEVASMTGLCRETLYGQIRAQALQTVKIGKRRLVPSEALRQWIDNARAA